MNVLAKIVIPKTNVTMGYINNELEELAREEFFRLKKVLEIKRKMYGGIQENKKGQHEDVSFCQTCMDDVEEQIDAVKDKSLNIVESEEEYQNESKEEEKSLNVDEIDKLIRQLSEIVDVAKEMDNKGIVKASVEEFIKTAQELKAKLGQKSDLEQKGTKSPPTALSVQEDTDINNLCTTCKEKYDEERADKQTDNLSTETESSLMKEESRETIQFKQSSSPSLSYEKDSELELGTFETEYKEITNIVKTKNKDGTITIKKKVTKIEKEIRTPVRSKSLPSSSRVSSGNKTNMSSQSSNTSKKSNPYSGSKTVGSVVIKSSITKANDVVQNKIQRQVKSEVLNSFLPMSDPTERLCISSITLLSTDLDFDFTKPIESYKDTLKLSSGVADDF